MARARGQAFFRTAMLLVVAAVRIAASAQPAGASQSGVDVNAANSMRNLCGWMGGAGDMDVNRVAAGIRSITVRCRGGGLNGLSCIYSPDGLICWWPMANQGPDGPSEQHPTFDSHADIAPFDADLPELTTELEPIRDTTQVDPQPAATFTDAVDPDAPAVDSEPTTDESVDPVVADPVVDVGQGAGSDIVDDPSAEPASPGLPTIDQTGNPVTGGETVADPVVVEPVIVEDVAVAAPSGGASPEIVEVEESEG